MALEDVGEAELSGGKLAAADGTAVATSTTSRALLSLLTLFLLLLLLSIGSIRFIFFLVRMRRASSGRRRRHQSVEEVDGQLVGHQVSLELVQRQLLAAQRALDLLLVAGWRTGRRSRRRRIHHRVVSALVSEQVDPVAKSQKDP